MIRKNNIKLGIIGGAGPLASCFLYKMLIEETQRSYQAYEDHDFPEIILINKPFSPMLSQQESVQNSQQLVDELQTCFTQLASLAITHCVIACNTLHSLMSRIDLRGMQFISLIESTGNYYNNFTKTLILGTQTTRESGIYAKLLNSKACYDTQSQEDVSLVINTVLKGSLEEKLAETLATLIKKDLKIAPFDAVILGCTELSVLNQLYPLNNYFSDTEKISIIDPLSIVTKNILKLIYN